MNAHCDLCNGLYGMRHPTQRFCGSKCRKKMQRVLEDRRGERVAAKRMRSVPPRGERYENACIAYSRATDEELRFTSTEAATYVLRGLRRCPRAFCGGVLQLVAVDGMAASR